jgi:Kdo2-lipid IVA lauroyltransferase/acyltransferase
LLYIISDILRFILFYVFGYRKKVINDNLNRAFPEKSKSEIKEIRQKFYKNFTDILLEGIKGLTMSDKSVFKRYKLLNPELSDYYFDQGISVIGLGAHYASWEWGVSIDKHLKHNSVCVYKAVANRRLNEYMRDKRERWGMKQISMEKTRTIFKNIDIPKFIILIADQSPSTLHNAIWANLLGIDTPCIHGPEAYGRLFNFPIIFMDFQRVKRGYYTLEHSLIEESPKNLEKGQITQKYMNKLEEVIRKKPQDWMWTHKRWKHKREGNKLFINYYYNDKNSYVAELPEKA